MFDFCILVQWYPFCSIVSLCHSYTDLGLTDNGSETEELPRVSSSWLSFGLGIHDQNLTSISLHSVITVAQGRTSVTGMQHSCEGTLFTHNLQTQKSIFIKQQHFTHCKKMCFYLWLTSVCAVLYRHVRGANEETNTGSKLGQAGVPIRFWGRNF